MAKRDRERSIQGWFDPESAEEKGVIKAFDYLRGKFPSMTPKWVIGNALLYAAQAEGFEPTIQPSKGFDPRVDLLMQQIERLTALMENGSFIPTSDAARQAYEEETVQLDAISASVGSRYVAMSFDEDEE